MNRSSDLKASFLEHQDGRVVDAGSCREEAESGGGGGAWLTRDQTRHKQTETDPPSGKMRMGSLFLSQTCALSLQQKISFHQEPERFQVLKVLQQLLLSGYERFKHLNLFLIICTSL